MSPNDLRRSARISSASYRPRTTWNLPHIITVNFFFLRFFIRILTKSLCQQSVTPSSQTHIENHVSEDDHMDVDNVPFTERQGGELA